MEKIKRFKVSEISPKRLLGGITRRINEIPHDLIWQYHPFSQKNKERINKYKNIHLGERCFIVANGPSLKLTNLDLLKNEYSFGLNRIYLNFENSTFRPTYFLAINELVLEQFAKDISQLDMPKFLNWNRRSFYNLLDPKTIFLKSKMVIEDSFQFDLTKPLVFGATVTFVAIQLAYYMGFQKVIIIGLDHNYKEKGEPSKTETRFSDKDESHFHSNYFPKGIKWQLPDLLRSEIEFDISRKVFEKDGREILDATIGGKCTIFNKIDYLSLF